MRATPNAEIELKLVGEPSELDSFFAALDGGGATTSTIVSTYYDTADRGLGRRGFALRLRHLSDGFELTLKGDDDHALKRGEWTTRMATPEADLDLLPSAAPRDQLGEIRTADLRPLFASEITRTSKIIVTDDAKIEASLDHGRITGGTSKIPVDEIEFELKDGSAAALLTYVRRTLGKRRLAFSGQSKAARGAALIDEAPVAAVIADKPMLDPSGTVSEAVAAIVHQIASHVVANLAAAADGSDPEGVHQLRVALRRLRSLFSLFEDRLADRAEALDRRAKKTLAILGRARDLDVFVIETLPDLRKDDGDRPDLTRLTAIALARRSDAHAKVRRMISRPRFNRFVLDLMLAGIEGKLLAADGGADPLRPTAAAMIERLHEKALSRGKNFDQLSDRQRHRVRIALKKLRYACNYFQTAFPKTRARAYVKRLARLQDDLGTLNDANVAQQIVAELTADEPESAISPALIKRWRQRRRERVETDLLEAWNAFAAARPFWRA